MLGAEGSALIACYAANLEREVYDRLISDDISCQV